MDMSTMPPSAIIIAFVPRRARPRVCIAIRGEMAMEGDIAGRFGLVPANDLLAIDQGGNP